MGNRNKAINLPVNEQELTRIDWCWKKLGFRNRNEFIRKQIMDVIEDEESQSD
jgi:metal-responsive CopG/Arc/MetJ family transcriptional regulator